MLQRQAPGCYIRIPSQLHKNVGSWAHWSFCFTESEVRPGHWCLPCSCLSRGPTLLSHILHSETAMATHSSTLAWKIPWMEEPGRLQSMGSQRVGHNWTTSLSLFTFLYWRRKWQPTPVFLPGESQGWEPGGLPSMGSHRVGHDWSDLTAEMINVSLSKLREIMKDREVWLRRVQHDWLSNWTTLLINNAVIVSDGQQKNSATHIHVSVLPQLPSHPDSHITLAELPVLYSRSLLVTHFKYSRCTCPSQTA